MQVTSIVVEGQACRDMYDEHPGLAYFYVDSSRKVTVSQPLSLEEGMAIAEAEWQRLRAELEAEEEEYDGQFSPTRIILRRGDGAIVQCYESSKWVCEFDSPDQWPAMLARASELGGEASFEAGWDNFSTANGLRAQAALLRRRVSIAQAHFGAQVET